ncbi:MAG: formate/nitrite transporter family protein [Deltaproteobacteria bacterium]|nr:MAG: formate/nitrite transporter family protein [Deltaproteobacteria bacterium]
MNRNFLTPAETAREVVAAGQRVLNQPPGRTLVLSFLAGVYIAFGAQLAIVVTSDAGTFFGAGFSRFLGGSVFSVGLMLVIVCGAELFTGNSLLVKAALNRRISWGKLLENWGLVIFGNLFGALFIAWLIVHSGLWQGSSIAEKAVAIAASKASLPLDQAFIRGILCNWLVCLAVVMAVAARDLPGKLLACYIPIMAFVASGFEHSVANMFFIPTGLLLQGDAGAATGLTWEHFLVNNLIPVTLGNIVGGVLFVAGAYWYTYLRGDGHQPS